MSIPVDESFWYAVGCLFLAGFVSGWLVRAWVELMHVRAERRRLRERLGHISRYSVADVLAEQNRRMSAYGETDDEDAHYW